MKKNGLLLSTLLILCSCGTPRIDESYAAEVVKKELSLSGNVTAQKLSGGHGDTMNFLATDGMKKYVVRFMGKKGRRERDVEIYNFNIASNEGYGPKVYFSDPSRAMVIMEYLSGEKVTEQDLASDQFYVALANLVKKIHLGENFGLEWFRRIDAFIQINKPLYGDYLPLAQLEQVVRVIRQALAPHLTCATCHNDLHSGNLLFGGDEFKAIDYEDVGPCDPYFDIAAIAATADSSRTHEKILLATYLGRQPTPVEEAKLYLMKQVIRIKWAFDAFYRHSPETLRGYKLIKAPSKGDKLDVSKPEDNLLDLKGNLTKVFDSAETQEFRDAINILTKTINTKP